MARCGSTDAVVVGSGPNGLAAAVALAREGCSVRVFEAEKVPGGGLRTLPLTLPGFLHDHCSSIHPLGVGSPFFRELPLSDHGLSWVYPEAPLAHPLDGGEAVVLPRGLELDPAILDEDALAWRGKFGWLVRNWPVLEPSLLGPPRVPSHPWTMARFALPALRPASRLARKWFSGPRARALFAGLAAHSQLALERSGTGAYGMILGALAHVNGWPFPRGGASRLATALIGLLEKEGGELVCGTRIRSLDDLPPARLVLLDLTPRQVLEICGDRLSARIRRSLSRYRYGCGVFKMDWALSGPVPWKDESCARAATVHIGGALEEIEDAERQVAMGLHPERPFLIFSQTSLFDDSRAPEGCHTAWAYTHVPNGSDVDMSERMEAQLERFAPGFRERILARAAFHCGRMEEMNANLVGGDINGGVQDLQQILARPRLSWNPYSLGGDGLFLCSSSSPPGGGVHGMCGYHAARAALRSL